MVGADTTVVDLCEAANRFILRRRVRVFFKEFMMESCDLIKVTLRGWLTWKKKWN